MYVCPEVIGPWWGPVKTARDWAVSSRLCKRWEDVRELPNYNCLFDLATKVVSIILLQRFQMAWNQKQTKLKRILTALLS